MKKRIIYYIIIGIFIITECFLMYFSYVNKNKIKKKEREKQRKIKKKREIMVKNKNKINL